MSVNVERTLRLLGKDYRVIDADGHILGRLCSVIAKSLLNGDKIVVVNAEKVVITGDRQMVFERYREKYERGSKEKGPYFPRHPERIFKRTVRGMLPKNRRGREALKNLRVFVGVPDKLKNAKAEKVDQALLEKVSKTDKFVTLGEVSEYLGYKVEVSA